MGTLAPVRFATLAATFNSVLLTDTIGARGQITADAGWPQCSVFCTAKPASGNEDDTLAVVAGAGNNATRFTGVVRRFRTSVFPKSIELVATGTLAYADEFSPNEDIDFFDAFPSGTTDQAIVRWVLDHVPGVSYTSGNIAGTGITLGASAPDAFDWRAGTTAWAYIQELDRATQYRTYQDRSGVIRRVQMIGHPSGSAAFTLAPEDVLDGSTGSRDTEKTKNASIVLGYDYGGTDNRATGQTFGSFRGLDGSDPAEQRADVFRSDLIEDGNDALGDPLVGKSGLNAQDIADSIIDDVLKEFVEASVNSWRDDTHEPGATMLLDMLARMAIGENLWVQRYEWEVGDNGWQSHYGLTGGGT